MWTFLLQARQMLVHKGEVSETETEQNPMDSANIASGTSKEKGKPQSGLVWARDYSQIRVDFARSLKSPVIISLLVD